MDSRPKKPAIGYARVSTEKQSEGVSIEAQQAEIISFAVASGYDLLDVAADEGISGSKSEDERPGLAEVLAALREGRAKAVIVTKRDRLARNQALAGHLETIIRRAGGELLIIDEGGVSEITKAVMTMVAEVERLLAIQRTRLAMRALKAKGVALGNIPFGYVRGENGRLEENAAEMAVVRQIVKMRGEGKTLKQIAAQLTDAGVPTKKGGRWSQEHVRLILQRSTGA